VTSFAGFAHFAVSSVDRAIFTAKGAKRAKAGATWR